MSVELKKKTCQCSGSQGGCLHCGGDNSWCPVHYPAPQPAATPQSGYTACACRDCMDITSSSDTSKPELCTECMAAGCDTWSPQEGRSVSECQRDDAYGEC